MQTDVQTPNPPIVPQVETPATYGPVPEQTESIPPKKKIPRLALVSVSVLILSLVALVIFQKNNASQLSLSPTPTPVATISATPTRVLNAIATQSAFTKFETDVDALTRGIANTQTQNQQLLPPRLELPLGF